VRRQDGTSLIADLVIVKSANKQIERRLCFVIRRWQLAASPPGCSFVPSLGRHWVDAPSAGSGESASTLRTSRGASRILASIVGEPNHTCGQHHKVVEVAQHRRPILIFNEYRDFSPPRQCGCTWRDDEGLLDSIQRVPESWRRRRTGSAIACVRRGRGVCEICNRDKAYRTANSAFFCSAILTCSLVQMPRGFHRMGAKNADRAKSRKLLADAVIKPTAVAAHTKRATQAIRSDSTRSGGKSSDKR